MGSLERFVFVVGPLMTLAAIASLGGAFGSVILIAQSALFLRYGHWPEGDAISVYAFISNTTLFSQPWDEEVARTSIVSAMPATDWVGFDIILLTLADTHIAVVGAISLLVFLIGLALLVLIDG